MLTKLKNGTHVDLATANIIQVSERVEPDNCGGVTKDRVIIKWQRPQDDPYGKAYSACVVVEYDTREEAQAEADRLAEIANSQRCESNRIAKAQDLMDLYYKAEIALLKRCVNSIEKHVRAIGDCGPMAQVMGEK